MLRREAPKTSVREGVRHVLQADLRFRLAFSIETENGVRPGMDTAVNHAREMDA